ncbi:aminoglycoside phosphotransferase family protein [Metabacillus sp. cB07]|uniref:aminoglycoside phosphotransferase family protein n=1 Tax=Metabacillus sp. cB07 TaxID=2806989 RepID=UPI00193A4D55|nr:aminoglycoside phosphotransferase family protein [Metabacillus sp. cB07]
MGTGNTAKVIAREGGTVAKVFYRHIASDFIEYEFAIYEEIAKTPLQVPRLFSFEKEEHALIFERIYGASLMAEMKRSPLFMPYHIRLLAKCHTDIHNCRDLLLPVLRDRLALRISQSNHLNEREKEKILSHLDGLPDHERVLCHGDFHPDNVLITKEGHVIIDWADAAAGSRLADIARSFLLINYGGLTSSRVQGVFRRILAGYYVRCYRKTEPFAKSELQKWILPVAAARLSESIGEREKEVLLKLIHARMNE